MKNLKLSVMTALILGTATCGFAGNNPAVTHQDGVMATTPTGQMEGYTPWNKGALKHMTAVCATGAWYRNCPVMTNLILSPKHEAEVTLSNGKQIMLSSASLKSVVEADLKKYAAFMYTTGASQTPLGDRPFQDRSFASKNVGTGLEGE